MQSAFLCDHTLALVWGEGGEGLDERGRTEIGLCWEARGAASVPGLSLGTNNLRYVVSRGLEGPARGKALCADFHKDLSRCTGHGRAFLQFHGSRCGLASRPAPGSCPQQGCSNGWLSFLLNLKMSKQLSMLHRGEETTTYPGGAPT